MKCKDARELIQAFIDNEITEGEKVQLETHLKKCEACQKVFDLAKKSKKLLTTNIVEEELPPYFEAKFWDRVKNETQQEGIFIPKKLISGFVGAMIVVIGFVFLFHSTRATTSEIYIVSPQPNHIISGEETTISAAFYPKPREGSISLVLNGKTVAPLIELTDDQIMYTSEESLDEGYYKVKVQLKDKDGKVQQEKEWLFYVVP